MAKDDTTMDRGEHDVEKLAPLADPVRRAIYFYVAGKRTDVSRDEAASALGIGRSLAAFHLDKLLENGLVEARYRRLSGRSGPGAGRPSKLYRAVTDIHVTVPHRDYELAARLLVEASRRDRRRRGGTLDAVAFETGRAIGHSAAGQADAGPRKRVRQRLRGALADRGYEPYTVGREIRLRNCPFHALADEYRDTICPMNLSLLRGILDGIGAGSLEAVPQQRPGECCVFIRAADAGGGAGHRRET